MLEIMQKGEFDRVFSLMERSFPCGEYRPYSAQRALLDERDYRIRCQYNWKPIGQTLQAFAEKGWTEKAGDRWHFTVPGYLISNTLIGILLEAQAGGRIEGTPWLSEVFEAEKKINIPKSEEELFTELYNQHTEKN